MEADARLAEESEEKPPQETFRPEILPGMVIGIACCLGNGHWINLFLGKHETGKATGNGHVQHASRDLEEEVCRRYYGAVSGKGG